MKRYWQFLQSYHFQKAPWPWASWKVQKGHTKINSKIFWDFDVVNTPIKLQLDTGNLRKVITFTRSYQMLPDWRFKEVIQRFRSNLVEILMSRTSLPVTTWCRQIMLHYHIHKELQDAAIWTWPSSKGQTKVNIALVRDCDVENISVKLQNNTGNSCRVIVLTRQLDLEQIWKFKKVTQRSMSKLFEIFM